MRLAFAAMLCRRSGDSTWDRPDGGGSELGALVHGHALKSMQSPESSERIDSLLLHVAITGQCGELRFRRAMHRAYDHIVRLDGRSRAEHAFISQMRHQPHLWLKLLVINLTNYDRIMWLGLDTMPLSNLAAGFACPTLPRVLGPGGTEGGSGGDLVGALAANASRKSNAPGREAVRSQFLNATRAPCIAASGNADTMLFQPDAALLERMVDDIVSPLGRRIFDGHAGYDQEYMRRRFKMGHMPVVQLTHTARVPAEPSARPFVYHWTAGGKPWYSAYCQTAPPNATLVMGPGDRRGRNTFTRSACPTTPLPSVFDFIWWQMLRDALNATTDASTEDNTHEREDGRDADGEIDDGRPLARADRVLTEWGVLEPLRQYQQTHAARACAPLVSAFAGLARWCPTT
jgi:hypothetical protein